MRFLSATFLLGSLFCAIGCDRQAVSSNGSFVFVDLDGVEHRPFESPEVKALVVVFIAPDCPIGNSYVPEINRLHAAFAPRGVMFVLAHSELLTTQEAAMQHAREFSIQPLVTLDRQQLWQRRCGATRIPEAALFSSSGELRYRGRIDNRHVGFGKRRVEATTHDLRAAIEAILEGRPVAQPVTEAVGCYLPQSSLGE